MRCNILWVSLLLAACTPAPSASSTPPAEIHPYFTVTPASATRPAEGLVVSLETPLPSPTPFTYTVQSGDTLSEIAERFHSSLDALMAANPDVNPSAMSIGQVLKIPSSPQDLTGEGTPTPVPFPVQQITCAPTSNGGMWCFVLVHNDSSEFMENVSAQVTLVGADGVVIASQPALLPLNILPPNKSLPLAAFFPPEVPAGAQPRVQILTANRLLPGDIRYLPAVLQNSLVKLDWAGRSAQVSGQVSLPPGGTAAGVVWVAAVAYDGSGSVVGVRRWEARAGLPAGGSLSFTFEVSSAAGRIASVDFAVEARP